MKVLAIYDLPTTIDRYTVYFDCYDSVRNGKKLHLCLGMSENPTSPLGFCQHSSGMIGNHNGKKITFKDLPEVCQKIVKDHETED